MKIYIKCMSKSKKDIWADLDDKASPLVEHLIKIILFQHRGNLKHWCDELGGFIHKVSTFKHNNKFPDYNFIYHSIWDNESKVLDITVDNVKFLNQPYKPYDISISDIRSFCESYISWLSKELSNTGRVYVSQCRDKALDLLSKYEED